MRKALQFVARQIVLFTIIVAGLSFFNLTSNVNAQVCKWLNQTCSSDQECCHANCSNNKCANSTSSVIRGTVFIDSNSNGTWDSGEQGVSSVTISLTGKGTKTTDSKGYYSFEGLTGGTRNVSISVPSGYVATTATSYSVETTGGTGFIDVDTRDFGIRRPATPTPTRTPTRTPTARPNTPTPTTPPVVPTNSPTPTSAQPPIQTYTITGYVFVDEDGDTTLSAPDERIQGAQIRITGPNSYGVTIVTNSAGFFRQDVPTHGSYNISRLSPPGYVDLSSNPKTVNIPQIQNNGSYITQIYFPLNRQSNPTSTPTPITPPTGSHTVTAGVFVDRDMNGIWQEQNDLILGGVLLVDYNGNGQYDLAEESGPRTRVILRRNNGTQVGNGYTAANGKINFNGIATGTYSLEFSEIPSTYSPTSYAYPPVQISNNYSRYLPLTVDTNSENDISSNVGGNVVSNQYGICSLTGATPLANVLVSINNTESPVQTWTDATDTNGNYSITVTDDPNNSHFINISNFGNLQVQCIILGNGTQIDTTSPSHSINFPDDTEVTFVLSIGQPWFMTDIGSVKQQRINNKVPEGKSPTSTSGRTASVFYSTQGRSMLGTASNLWKVDNEYDQTGSNNREGNASYSFYIKRSQQTGPQLVNLPHCPTSGRCTFSRPLSELDHQVLYHVDGDLIFNPSDPLLDSNARVVILVNGTLTINRDARVRDGKSLLILAAKNNVIIGNDVGQLNPESSAPNIQAIITAEDNITIQGTADCPANPDRRLNIEGTLVANSDNPFGVESSGGKLINNRTLCSADSDNPSLYVKSRLSFITSLTDFYKVSTSIWNEVEP